MSVLNKEDELQLIARAADGHRESCGDLIRHYQGSLYAYLLKLSGRPEMAEDITQEAFVRVLNHLDRFDPQYRFSTWLFTIARRLYLNAVQKSKPAYDTDAIGGLASDHNQPGDRIADHEEQRCDRRAIERALAGLSEEQRQIILLFHQQDWPIAIIAQHMGMPEGTVKSHLHRGRRRLRVFLEHEERYAARTQAPDASEAGVTVRASLSAGPAAGRGGAR